MYKTIEGDEIVIGGVYEDRERRVYRINRFTTRSINPVNSTCGESWTGKGEYYKGTIDEQDLIRRVDKPKDDWIENTGEKPDLPEGTLVDCKYLNGTMKTNVACIDDFPHKRWEITSDSYSITHYRIHKPDIGIPTSENVDTLLNEREKRYGQFKAHTEIAQGIKLAMHQTPKWNALKPHQKESLDMIAHKIARILNGDPDYPDNWRDISGYSELVVRELSK